MKYYQENKQPENKVNHACLSCGEYGLKCTGSKICPDNTDGDN